MATEKFIPESNAAPVAFNSKRHAAHQQAYRLRRKDGRVAALLPWRWLTLQDVQRLAVEAYRSASYGLSRDLPDPNCSPKASPMSFSRPSSFWWPMRPWRLVCLLALRGRPPLLGACGRMCLPAGNPSTRCLFLRLPRGMGARPHGSEAQLLPH